MASPVNRHCANCIGTLSCPMSGCRPEASSNLQTVSSLTNYYQSPVSAVVYWDVSCSSIVLHSETIRIPRYLKMYLTRQTVHTHCASVHQAAKLVAALL